MAFFNDRVLDSGLTILDTEATRLDLCSQEPASYAAATSTYTLANKTSLSIGAPADRGAGGRKVTVAAIADGTVTGNGTPTHWAITDTANSRLLATGPISSTQALVSGNTFTLEAFDIYIPDAA